MNHRSHRSTRRAATLVGIASILALSVAACAGFGGAPDWVESASSPEYPKSEYVTALGTGETLEAAGMTAKGELSQIFSAELESAVELVEEESMQDGRAFSQSDLFADTRISTHIVLEGVEVPLHWRDPATGQTWALAVLERRKECLRIRDEGEHLMARLDRRAISIESWANPLLAVRAAVQAAKIGAELDALNARSRVLGSRCISGDPVPTGEMRAEVDARLSNLSFVIRAQDIDARTGKSLGSLPQLRERIADNLTSLGFQVGPSSGDDVIPIDAWLRLSRVDRGTDWVEYRWEGFAEIGSPVDGAPAVIAAQSEGAESHPEDSTARLRARRKGEQDLSERLDTLLKAFLAEAAES
jgi:hypothetical protein